MNLTPEQKSILDGSQGEIMAKVMKTIVMYGDTFGAEKLVPVTGKYGHLVTSFGFTFLTPVHKLMNKLIEAGAVSQQKFTVDPRPVDKNVPSGFIEEIVFKVMYAKQNSYEGQLKKLGLLSDDSFTCTCYLDEVGNKPQRGDVLSWAESSAVVFANSVLGARCNRNSGILELFGSILGQVPYYGLLTDEGRKASWIIDIKTTVKPDAQVLGSAIGMKVMEGVPFVMGLDRFIGTEINETAISYLKDFGAAAASNGSVGLYHIQNLTPEAKDYGEKLILKNAERYLIDDKELQHIKESYPCIWKDMNARPELCFIGCPHMTFNQIVEWTQRIEDALDKAGNSAVTVPTVFTASPAVVKKFSGTEFYSRLDRMGVIVSSICPLMYMDNPLCLKKPVITTSNKLRTYSSTRFYGEDEILSIITKGDKHK